VNGARPFVTDTVTLPVVAAQSEVVDVLHEPDTSPESPSDMRKYRM
jgi:hypothetical protein